MDEYNNEIDCGIYTHNNDCGTYTYVNLVDKTIALTKSVDMQVWYSNLKEVWDEDVLLIEHTFPLLAITSEQFEFQDGWVFRDLDGLSGQMSRKFVRNAGWTENHNGWLRTFAGIQTVGSIHEDSQVWYRQHPKHSYTPFSRRGPVNEAIELGPTNDFLEMVVASNLPNNLIEITGYGASGPQEHRQGFAKTGLEDTGSTELEHRCYRFPLVNFVN